MIPDEIISLLSADGWREFKAYLENDGARAFYKCFENVPECKCNQGKRKQLEIYFRPQERIFDYIAPPRFEVKCTGELPNNQWLRMGFEGLTKLDEINQCVASLLAAWTSAVESTPNIDKI